MVKNCSITLLLLLFAAGCSSSSDETAKEGNDQYTGTYPIQVVATIGMVADVVRNVGGEHVKVDQICGPGVDPHLYHPLTDDVRMLSNADMVFYCGLMLEGKMTDSLIQIARKRPVHAVTEMISQSLLLEPEEFSGHFDPHVWNDVSAWSQTVTVVEKSLANFDPQHASEYEQNGAEYRKKLATLHQYGIDSLATVPAGRRVLVTSHDAFNYFGRAYELEVIGVQGLSTESEAGVQHINNLVDMLVQKNVKAVFVESTVPRKNIQALQEGAASKGHEVVIGGELFSDAMGLSGTYEATYEGMLDHNITVVTRGLGGVADELGLNGKLSTENE
jgi:manganese/zinc/iron transport system substrate-binding protein